MIEPKLPFAIRRWGPTPESGDLLVLLEVGVFVQAVLWRKHNSNAEWGFLLGSKTPQPDLKILVEHFAAHESAGSLGAEQVVGAVFWRDDGSTDLTGEQVAVLRGLESPPLALVLESSRRCWSLFMFKLGLGYSRIPSVNIFQKQGDIASLNKTLVLLDGLEWSNTGRKITNRVETMNSEAYHLRNHVLTIRKTFLWGGLLGLFLGAMVVAILMGILFEVKTPSEPDRIGFVTTTAENPESGNSAPEQARTLARLQLERALAGNPDEILQYCTDIVAQGQCREALDRLRVAPQHSLSYNVEGVQVSTTIPGMPAFLFEVDVVKDGFKISGVRELSPPVELGTNPQPKSAVESSSKAEPEIQKNLDQKDLNPTKTPEKSGVINNTKGTDTYKKPESAEPRKIPTPKSL